MDRVLRLLVRLHRAWFAFVLIGVFSATSASSQGAGDQRLDLDKLVAQAEAGDAISQNLLGALYQTGSGMGRDLAKAAEWYERAADQGLSAAQVNLGTLYLGRLFKMFGYVEEPIKGRGKELLERAAKRGDPFGMARLGSFYLRTGQGEKAIPLLKKAVDLHVGLAAFEMANAYKWGTGVAQDETEAKKWILRSSDMGYPAGQYYHALDYETDLARQFDLYQRAAIGGDPLAQWALGSIYEHASQYRDLDKAAYWYTKAALNGNEMGNQGRFRLGLPDINGNPPVNSTVLTTSPSEIVLDDHTTVAAAAAAFGIALVILSAGQGDAADLGSEPFCIPCSHEEVAWPDNQCQHSITGVIRTRVCIP